MLVWRWHATYHWKVLDECYNFALDLIAIRGLHVKLWAPKVARVLVVKIPGLSLVARQNANWMWPRGKAQETPRKGRGVIAPKIN